eukprot:CAMPEP_0201169576 /NCGR_PEP_ID=MMETSP0851-20130426/80688_1 /ASSEMBLY_ACC=CAM_ASM_000631 /TAXON_ID=183588 /ORGANISM="Pseudo-nitzschia fraudulenta, Strain WWA7" /LENGTH=420 /DNA_ID=CAMNT_0047451371 /DNA_START=93 /DNA_END=1355 /DNA_ORIENTATION=+
MTVSQNPQSLRWIALIAAAVAMSASPESPLPTLQFAAAFLPTTTTKATIARRDTFLAAGFGSPASASNKKKKGKNKNKKKGGGGETAAQVQQRWANKMKRVYGGISKEEIAIGTEKRIESMMVESLSEPLRNALALRSIVEVFERRISGMGEEDIRQRFTPEELQEAIANRKAFDEHMEANNLAPEDLQVAMQRLTWDAGADAKACRSVTGKMAPITKIRVARASEMAYEGLTDNSDDDGLILDVGCGYGVMVPFLKKAGFKAHQIHGVDLSSEMIGHAKSFYPDVATEGKFEVVDFFEDAGGGDDQEQTKYRAVVFCSALHDMPDLKSALIKTKNELLDAETPGSRLVVLHAQGASHVLNQNKQNPLLVPRGMPSTEELKEWLCGDDDKGPTMRLVHEPAEPKSQGEVREGYLAVLEIV